MPRDCDLPMLPCWPRCQGGRLLRLPRLHAAHGTSAPPAAVTAAVPATILAAVAAAVASAALSATAFAAAAVAAATHAASVASAALAAAFDPPGATAVHAAVASQFAALVATAGILHDHSGLCRRHRLF